MLDFFNHKSNTCSLSQSQKYRSLKKKIISLSSPSDPIPSKNQYYQYQSLLCLCAQTYAWPLCFSCKETEAQRAELTFLRSHSWPVAELGVRSQLSRLPVPRPMLLWFSCLLRESCLPKWIVNSTEGKKNTQNKTCVLSCIFHNT